VVRSCVHGTFFLRFFFLFPFSLVNGLSLPSLFGMNPPGRFAGLIFKKALVDVGISALHTFSFFFPWPGPPFFFPYLLFCFFLQIFFFFPGHSFSANWLSIFFPPSSPPYFAFPFSGLPLRLFGHWCVCSGRRLVIL